MALADIEGAFARTPTTLVELTVVGDITGSEVFRFSPKLGEPLSLQLGVTVRAYLIGEPRGRPSKIEPDKALTQRSRLSLNFADDVGASTNFDASKFSIATGGSFWRRLVLTQPDLVGSTIEVKRGFVDSSLALGDFETIFKGRIEDFDFQENLNFTIVAKDILTLADREVPKQVSDANQLNGALTSSATTIPIDKGLEFTDAGDTKVIPSKDFHPIVLEIQPESVDVLLTTASTWTASTQRIAETNAFANYTFVKGDKIFLSHASITDGLFEIALKISDSTIELVESISGSDLSSPGPISDPREDVILNDVSANDLIVQANFLVRSEEFDNAAWTKTGATVTADRAVGPFGGDAGADEIAFASAADFIKQDSAESSVSTQFAFSVWLKKGLSPTTSSPFTITIDLILDNDTELDSLQVTITDDWQRFEHETTFSAAAGRTAVVRIRRDTGDAAEVIAFGAQLEKASSRGFYAATAASAGTDAGRGAFGTTAAAHADNTAIAEVIPYRLQLSDSGLHPGFILRDLINRGSIAPADVDQTTFDREFAFEESTQLRRSGRLRIVKPRKLSQHVKEVRQQALLDLWMSEKGKVSTRFSFRQNLPGVNTKTITDAANILKNMASYKGNKESRKTEVYVYFNPVPGESDPREPEDFQNVQVTVDVSVGLASGPKAEIILSKWIFRATEAIAVSGRLVSRFKRGARIATWSLDLKDSEDFFLGDVIELDSEDVPLAGLGGVAVRGKSNWQVIKKDHRRLEGRLEVQGLEFSGLKFGIISPDDDLETAPDPFPDFPAASAAERAYGFISDNDGKVAGALTTAPFTLVSASYTASTKRITETGKFASYTFSAGDAFFPVHASAHLAFYLIASKIDNDTIELEVPIKNVVGGVDDSGDLAGLTNNTAKWRDQLEAGYVIL